MTTSDEIGGGLQLTSQPASSDVVAAPLADQIFEKLRTWVINGDLPPGTRLRIRDLADAVGTSVMPVREAVRRLVEAGLAEHTAYKGARVRTLDVTELEKAYDVRVLLEGECARLGATAATPEVTQRMRAAWEALQAAVRAGDVGEALLQDEALLDALYEAADNRVMHEMIRNLWVRCRPYKVIWASGGGNEDSGLDIWHHKPELISAVERNDGAEAQDILCTSYLEAKAAIRSTLARRN